MLAQYNVEKSWMLVLFLLLVLTPPVFADGGPKPQVYIDIKYAGAQNTKIVSGILLRCIGPPGQSIPRGLVWIPAAQLANYGKDAVSSQVVSRLTDDTQKTRSERIDEINIAFKVRQNEKLTLKKFATDEVLRLLGSREGNMLAYVDNECIWVRASFAWGTCKNNRCHFWYAPPDTFRLALLTDKNQIIVTPPVQRTRFTSHYEVVISPDGRAEIREVQKVDEQTLLDIIYATILTIIIEVCVALLWCRKHNISPDFTRRIAILVVLLNLITVPALNISVVTVGNGTPFSVVIGEFLAVVFEGESIYRLQACLSRKKAYTLSLLMNVASFLGSILVALLTGFIFT